MLWPSLRRQKVVVVVFVVFVVVVGVVVVVIANLEVWFFFNHRGYHCPKLSQ